MESILPYLIQTVGGAGGGFLGNMVKPNALGGLGNLIAGAVGGNALPLIIGALNLFGGGNTLTTILTSVLGGGLGSLIGGLLKKA